MVPFGSPEWEYGPQLKAKLEQFAAAIAGALSATMSKEMRSELIEAIRTGKRWGGLKRWTVSAGAIYAPFVAAQSAAVDALAPEAQGCDIVLSLERGGALAQDELLSGTHQPSQVIPKRTMTTVEIDAAVQLGHLSEDERKVLVAPGTHGKHKVQQQADLRAKIDELMASDPAQAMTIAIAETRVGGGSVDGLVKSAKAALATGRYPNLKFKILALDQTMHRDEENAAQGVTYLPVAGAAGKIQVVISSTPYILGEDVAVQLSRTGKAPVIVFNATEDRIAAYRITPQSDTVTRDIILDLVDGAYNAFLPGVM